MADLDDVSNVLVNLAVQTMYPDGTSQPSIVAKDTIVVQGWPIPDDLDRVLRAGGVYINVWPDDNEFNTTRHLDFDEWYVVQQPPAPTITLTKSGTDVVVGGTVTLPQNVGFIVDNKTAAYALQQNDTLTTIASAVASRLVTAGVVATSTGPTIHLPNSSVVTARVGTWGRTLRQLSRQEKMFSIIIWAKDPVTRGAVAAPLDVALKSLSFISLPDGSEGRIRYVRTVQLDRYEKHLCYRRDLCYTVEWATTEVSDDPQINIFELNLRAPDNALIRRVNF